MDERYQSFAALIYATEIEEAAVMRMFDWEELHIDGDIQLYYVAYTKNNKKILCACQDELGMTAAATLTMKLIENFRPKYIIMPGIAAGTVENSSDQQMFGDVIVADMTWNYSSGQYVSQDKAKITFGDIGFLPMPTLVRSNESLMSSIMEAIQSPYNEDRVYVGAIASGSSVIADKSFVDKRVRNQLKNTIGLEMEAYGVAYASAHAKEPRPQAIIAKGISDFADENKTDLYQKFAAHTSCEFVKFIIENHLK